MPHLRMPYTHFSQGYDPQLLRCQYKWKTSLYMFNYIAEPSRDSKYLSGTFHVIKIREQQVTLNSLGKLFE